MTWPLKQHTQAHLIAHTSIHAHTLYSIQCTSPIHTKLRPLKTLDKSTIWYFKIIAHVETRWRKHSEWSRGGAAVSMARRGYSTFSKQKKQEKKKKGKIRIKTTEKN